MARSCMIYHSSPVPDASLGQSSDFHNAFFQYAAEYWTLHFREGGDKIDTELLQRAIDLCQAKANNLPWLTSNTKDFDWSGWPNLHIAAYFGLDAVVRAIIEDGGVDINATGGKFGTVLHVASRRGYQSVVKILLDHEADVNVRWCDQSPLYVACFENRFAIAGVLFAEGADRIQVRMADLVIAAHRFDFDLNIFGGFLKALVDKVMLTPENLAEACASDNGHNAWVLLSKFKHKEIQVTPHMIVLAARNRTADGGVMNQLLQAWNDQIEITPEALQAAAQNELAGDRVMAILLRELQRRCIQIESNEELFVAAATNKIGQFIVPQLFELAGAENTITPRVLAAAASNKSAGVRIMGIIFAKAEFRIEMTDDVVSAAKTNKRQGKWVLELIELFRQDGKDRELVLREIAERHAQMIKERPWKDEMSYGILLGVKKTMNDVFDARAMIDQVRADRAGLNV